MRVSDHVQGGLAGEIRGGIGGTGLNGPEGESRDAEEKPETYLCHGGHDCNVYHKAAWAARGGKRLNACAIIEGISQSGDCRMRTKTPVLYDATQADRMKELYFITIICPRFDPKTTDVI